MEDNSSMILNKKMGIYAQADPTSLHDAEFELYNKVINENSRINDFENEINNFLNQNSQISDNKNMQDDVQHETNTQKHKNMEIFDTKNGNPAPFNNVTGNTIKNTRDINVNQNCHNPANVYDTELPTIIPSEDRVPFIYTVDSVQKDIEEYLKNENDDADISVNNAGTAPRFSTAFRPSFPVPAQSPSSQKSSNAKFNQKTRNSFRLSILDVLNKKDQVDISRYYVLSKDKQTPLFENNHFYNNSVLETMHPHDSYNPKTEHPHEFFTSIISDYYPPHDTTDNLKPSPYHSNFPDHPPFNLQPLLTKISLPTEHFHNELSASKSIITPPPSDIALTAFKTTSSDSVLSNDHRIVHLHENQKHRFNEQVSSLNKKVPRIYLQCQKQLNYFSNNKPDSAEILQANYYAAKKTSFDPISALDEVLLLQNLDGEDGFNTHNSIQNYDSYCLDDIIEPLSQIKPKSTNLQRDYQPPETHYDQKSTLMLTDLANNFNRLSILESPLIKKGNNWESQYPRSKIPEQITQNHTNTGTSRQNNNVNSHYNPLRDRVVAIDEPSQKQKVIHNNTRDINNDSIEEKIIRNLRKNFSEDPSEDSNTGYVNTTGVGKLYERQYRLAVTEKMEMDRKNAINSRKNGFFAPNKTSWEDNNTEWDFRLSKSKHKHNGMPRTDSSLNVFNDLKKVVDCLSPKKNHNNTKKDHPTKREAIVGTSANPYTNMELGQHSPLEIFCDCPRVLLEKNSYCRNDDVFSSNNGSKHRRNNSSKNKTEIENFMTRNNTFHYDNMGGNNNGKLNLKRSGSIKSFLSNDKNERSHLNYESSNLMQPMSKNTKPPSANFFSKLSRIKNLFSASNKRSKYNSSEQIKVIHKPHCTLTRSSSISKDSLPIIPSLRSSSFYNMPLQSILKTQHNNGSIKQKIQNDLYYTVDNPNELNDKFSENNHYNQNPHKNRGKKPEFSMVDCDNIPFVHATPDHVPLPQSWKRGSQSNNAHVINRPTIQPSNYEINKIPPPRLATRPGNFNSQFQLSISPVPTAKHPKQRFLKPPTTICPPPRRRLSFLNQSPRRVVYPAQENRAVTTQYPPGNDNHSIMKSVCNNRKYVNQVFTSPRFADGGGPLLMETSAGLDTDNRRNNFSPPFRANFRNRSRTCHVTTDLVSRKENGNHVYNGNSPNSYTGMRKDQNPDRFRHRNRLVPLRYNT